MSFSDQPILNSPYHPPTRHHATDTDGQPLDAPPLPGRRPSKLITPVPQPRKKSKKPQQANLGLSDSRGISTADQEYTEQSVVNTIRFHVGQWRALPNPKDWGVTPATERLLLHWRTHAFQNQRPFFCQVEAAETAIWLAEVARKRHPEIGKLLEAANHAANPGLPRIALKMATGSGKTTVMAMLIAWQTVNAVRNRADKRFTRGFLVVTPGITIRDRLQVLQTNDDGNYYRTRELVPADMWPDIDQARIVITNYHAFRRRETMELSKVARATLKPTHPTVESDDAMVHRVARDLDGLRNIVVINDEAHHCYREKPGEAVAPDREAKQSREAAGCGYRAWKRSSAGSASRRCTTCRPRRSSSRDQATRKGRCFRGRAATSP